MELVINYHHNNQLRNSFNQLAQKTFGISFEKWYQKGLWPDNYICYSFKEDNQIIANVSVTKMKLQTTNAVKDLIQLGTVMTAKKYRGQGLARKLLETVIDHYEPECAGFYLFANHSVKAFYPKFGFEKEERMEIYTKELFTPELIYHFRKINPQNDDDLKVLVEISRNRIPTSRSFYFKDSEGILYWYCLGLFKDNIYYNQDNNLIVIYGIDGNIMNIYDIITTDDISYKNILKSLASEDIDEVIFHFNIESDDLKLEKRIFNDQKEDDPMFVRGNLQMDGLTYPITYHT